MSNTTPPPVAGTTDAAQPVTRIRSTAWAFALLWILLLELLLRAGMPVPIPRDYRVPNQTSAGIGPVIDKLGRADGPRVALVGDSVAWGMFAERDEATGARLEAMLHERFGDGARVANCGLISAHPNDYLPVVVDLLEEDATDAIVIQFDARFYSKNHAVTYRYPELYDRIDGARERAALASATPPPFKWTGGLPTAQEADRILSDLSMIWRLRFVPMTALFDVRTGDGALWESIRQFNYQRPRVFVHKKPENLPLARVKFDYDIPPYESDGAYFIDLAIALDMAERKGVPVILYAGPVDGAMMDELRLWDGKKYAERIAFAQAFTERHGATFIDLTSAVPPEALSDTHHPLKDGYRIIAEILAPPIATALTEAGEKR